MVSCPIRHSFPFHRLFPQSLFNDFKVISRHWFMPNLNQVPQTQTQIKTLPLKGYTSVNIIISFLIIWHPISYTSLKYHVNFITCRILQFCVLYSIAIISVNKLITLCEKSQYSEFFWSVFSLNARKYGPEILWIRTLFAQCNLLW